MPDRLDRQMYGQSFSSVPQRPAPETRSGPTTRPRSPYRQSFSSILEELVSEYRYGPTPDGPLLPPGVTRPRRSSPRLRTFDYTGPYAYSLTLNTDGARRCFGDERFTNFCVSKLLETAAKCRFDILAYCFMPNHVHLLVKGLDSSSKLGSFVQQFKQALGYAYKLEHRRPLWHRSYHDHVARTDEDLDRAAAYIWANPVRAGIVERIEDYRWSGPRERIESSSGRPGLVRSGTLDRHVGGQSLGSVPTGGRGPRERIESGPGRSESVRNVKPNRSVGGQSSSSVPTIDPKVGTGDGG